MTVYELADILRATIVAKRYEGQNGRITAHFEDYETKESEFAACLEGTYGDSDTWDGAVADYARKISGRILVFKAFNEDRRREFRCPELEIRERLESRRRVG